MSAAAHLVYDLLQTLLAVVGAATTEPLQDYRWHNDPPIRSPSEEGQYVATPVRSSITAGAQLRLYSRRQRSCIDVG